MEQATRDVTPAPELTELQKAENEFNLKCHQVGVLDLNLEELDSQKRETEKNLEVARRARNALLAKLKAAREKEFKKNSKQPEEVTQ